MSAVASLPSFGLAPEVCTPASNDKDEADNESSGTLKPAREAIDPRKVNPTCRLMINTSSLIRHSLLSVRIF